MYTYRMREGGGQLRDSTWIYESTTIHASNGMPVCGVCGTPLHEDVTTCKGCKVKIHLDCACGPPNMRDDMVYHRAHCPECATYG